MKNVIVNSSPMAINCFEHEMFPEITLKSNVLAIYFTVSLAVRTWPATANGLATETLKKKTNKAKNKTKFTSRSLWHVIHVDINKIVVKESYYRQSLFEKPWIFFLTLKKLSLGFWLKTSLGYVSFSNL